MRTLRRLSILVIRIGLLVVLVGLVGLGVVSAPQPRDLGALRIVVLQSDDWGLEGWFPDSTAAAQLVELTQDWPTALGAYTRSTLESAADVDSLSALLADYRGVSGLPAILQANTVVAGPDLDDRVAPEGAVGWPVHASGEGRRGYSRPGLREAVDAAIQRGTWWPELHGLTHFDLFEYARARRRGDRLERRARDLGTFAYDGFLQDTELGHDDPTRAHDVATMATAFFERRFGRRPTSVIAPDYRWTAADESAWQDLGIRVVQAKREQVDPNWDLGSWKGRILKRLRANLQRHRGRFVYLDRPARLEPYGSLDLDAPQGARAAAAAVRAAWQRGEAGVISIHRVQLVSLDPAIARAGRAQLRVCLESLLADGPVAFLVDTEVAQLLDRGWSVFDRGGVRVLRNALGHPISVDPGVTGGRRILPPGTTTFPWPPRRGE